MRELQRRRLGVRQLRDGPRREHLMDIKIPTLMFLNTATRDGRIIPGSSIDVRPLPIPIAVDGTCVGAITWVSFDGNVVSAAGHLKEPLAGDWWPAADMSDVDAVFPRRRWWDPRRELYTITGGQLAGVTLHAAASDARPAWKKIMPVEIGSI
jgi:hypothetical protein